MEVLARERFDYAVLAEGEDAFIVVTCGTSALFEVRIRKTRKEAMALLADESRLRAMAMEVRLDPPAYGLSQAS
jgi:hypothetical protein